MKKTLFVLVALSLVLAVTTSLAAGRLMVTKEDFHVVKEYRNYAYAYARVENVGDRPIAINAGLLEVYDVNGDAVTSTDRLYAYAKYLQPEEYTYVRMYAEVEEDTTPDQVDDHLLTVTAKSERSYTTLRLPCTTDYKEDVGSGYSKRNYMYAVVTNDTDEPLSEISVVLVLLDGEDNILYMDSDSIGYYQRLMPNSSMEFALSLDSRLVDYFVENNITPARVDAIAYVYLEDD